MNRQTDRQTGKLPPTLQIVLGYLTEDLDAATVAGGVLTPTTAKMRVWGYDAERVPTATTSGDDGLITVTNWIEDFDATANSFFVAVWFENLKIWHAPIPSCGASALPVGGS